MRLVDGRFARGWYAQSGLSARTFSPPMRPSFLGLRPRAGVARRLKSVPCICGGDGSWLAPTTPSTPTAISWNRSISGTNTSIPPSASDGRGSPSTRTARSAFRSKAKCWATRAGSAASARSASARARSSPTPSNTPRGRRAGSTRTPASSTWTPTVSMLLSCTRASASSPARSQTPGSRAPCAAPTIAGSPITASPIPTGYSGSRCCRCSRSTSRSTRCATRARRSACAAAFCGRTRITATR